MNPINVNFTFSSNIPIALNKKISPQPNKTTTNFNTFHPNFLFEDNFLKQLIKNGWVNEEGLLKKTIPFSLPPLSEKPLIRLFGILNENQLLEIDQCPITSFNIKNIINALSNNFSQNIQKIEIVGSTVLYILGNEYLVNALKPFLGKLAPLFASHPIKKPFDYDIRLHTPSIPDSQLTKMTEFVISHLSFTSNNLLPHINYNQIKHKGLKKLNKITTDENIFSIICLGSKNQVDIEFIFWKKLLRKHLFLSDNLRISLNPIYSPIQNIPIIPSSDHHLGWQAIIDNVAKILHVDDIKSVNHYGWPTLISKYTKGWRSFQKGLEQSLFEKVLSIPSIQNLPFLGIATLLHHSFNHHHKSTKEAKIAFTFNAITHLQDKVDDDELKMIWRNLSARLLQKNLDKTSNISFLSTLYTLLEEENTPFSLIDASLQLLSFFHIANKSFFKNNEESIFFTLTKNEGKPATQININWNNYLLINFDINNALKTIEQEKDLNRLNKIFSSFKNFFPKPLPKEGQSPVCEYESFLSLNLDLIFNLFKKLSQSNFSDTTLTSLFLLDIYATLNKNTIPLNLLISTLIKTKDTHPYLPYLTNSLFTKISNVTLSEPVKQCYESLLKTPDPQLLFKSRSFHLAYLLSKTKNADTASFAFYLLKESISHLDTSSQNTFSNLKQIILNFSLSNPLIAEKTFFLIAEQNLLNTYPLVSLCIDSFSKIFTSSHPNLSLLDFTKIITFLSSSQLSEKQKKKINRHTLQPICQYLFERSLEKENLKDCEAIYSWYTSFSKRLSFSHNLYLNFFNQALNKDLLYAEKIYQEHKRKNICLLKKGEKEEKHLFILLSKGKNDLSFIKTLDQIAINIAKTDLKEDVKSTLFSYFLKRVLDKENHPSSSFIKSFLSFITSKKNPYTQEQTQSLIEHLLKRKVDKDNQKLFYSAIFSLIEKTENYSLDTFQKFFSLAKENASIKTCPIFTSLFINSLIQRGIIRLAIEIINENKTLPNQSKYELREKIFYKCIEQKQLKDGLCVFEKIVNDKRASLRIVITWMLTALLHLNRYPFFKTIPNHFRAPLLRQNTLLKQYFLDKYQKLLEQEQDKRALKKLASFFSSYKIEDKNLWLKTLKKANHLNLSAWEIFYQNIYSNKLLLKNTKTYEACLKEAFSKDLDQTTLHQFILEPKKFIDVFTPIKDSPFSFEKLTLILSSVEKTFSNLSSEEQIKTYKKSEYFYAIFLSLASKHKHSFYTQKAQLAIIKMALQTPRIEILKTGFNILSDYFNSNTSKTSILLYTQFIESFNLLIGFNIAFRDKFNSSGILDSFEKAFLSFLKVYNNKINYLELLKYLKMLEGQKLISPIPLLLKHYLKSKHLNKIKNNLLLIKKHRLHKHNIDTSDNTTATTSNAFNQEINEASSLVSWGLTQIIEDEKISQANEILNNSYLYSILTPPNITKLNASLFQKRVDILLKEKKPVTKICSSLIDEFYGFYPSLPSEEKIQCAKKVVKLILKLRPLKAKDPNLFNNTFNFFFSFLIKQSLSDELLYEIRISFLEEVIKEIQENQKKLEIIFSLLRNKGKKSILLTLSVKKNTKFIHFNKAHSKKLKARLNDTLKQRKELTYLYLDFSPTNKMPLNLRKKLFDLFEKLILSTPRCFAEEEAQNSNKRFSQIIYHYYQSGIFKGLEEKLFKLSLITFFPYTSCVAEKDRLPIEKQKKIFYEYIPFLINSENIHHIECAIQILNEKEIFPFLTAEKVISHLNMIIDKYKQLFNGSKPLPPYYARIIKPLTLLLTNINKETINDNKTHTTSTSSKEINIKPHFFQCWINLTKTLGNSFLHYEKDIYTSLDYFPLYSVPKQALIELLQSLVENNSIPYTETSINWRHFYQSIQTLSTITKSSVICYIRIMKSPEKKGEIQKELGHCFKMIYTLFNCLNTINKALNKGNLNNKETLNNLHYETLSFWIKQLASIKTADHCLSYVEKLLEIATCGKGVTTGSHPALEEADKQVNLMSFSVGAKEAILNMKKTNK